MHPQNPTVISPDQVLLDEAKLLHLYHFIYLHGLALNTHLTIYRVAPIIFLTAKTMDNYAITKLSVLPVITCIAGKVMFLKRDFDFYLAKCSNLPTTASPQFNLGSLTKIEQRVKFLALEAKKRFVLIYLSQINTQSGGGTLSMEDILLMDCRQLATTTSFVRSCADPIVTKLENLKFPAEADSVNPNHKTEIIRKIQNFQRKCIKKSKLIDGNISEKFNFPSEIIRNIQNFQRKYIKKAKLTDGNISEKFNFPAESSLLEQGALKVCNCSTPC